jgi:hypothetical protein
MKQTFKKFYNLIKKTLFKPVNKTNNFYKKIKIVKYFDVFVENTLLKVSNKIKNFSKQKSLISNFNKVIITFISLLFIYMFYLLVPTLYDKTWVQNTLENKLVKDFKINFSTSSDITYLILPTPHFLVKDAKIFIGNDNTQKIFSEIKKLKVFIHQTNFFKREKMNIKKILINDANFLVKGKDLKILNESILKKFSNKKIKIKNSNIFFKNTNDDIINIIKIPEVNFFYDEIRLLNLFNLSGKVFKTPITFNLEQDISSKKHQKINFESKKLNLKIENDSIKESKDQSKGVNTISVSSSKLETLYSIKKKLITFRFNSLKTKNSNIDYQGKLSISPFDFILKADLKNYDTYKLINNESIISELIQTKLFFNENISANISINVDSRKHNELFHSSIIKLNAINGKINFDNSKLINKKIGFLELNDSDLVFQNNKLILRTNALIKIQNLKNLFSMLQTPKKSRKLIKNILINIDYDLLTNQIKINNLKINNTESTDEIINILDELNNSESYNLNRSKRLLNRIIFAYEG